MSNPARDFDDWKLADMANDPAGSTGWPSRWGRCFAAEVLRLRQEVAMLRQNQVPQFDNGACLACGVAHKDTGMPCPSLRVTALSRRENDGV